MFLKQVPFDDHIQVIIGSIFTKLAIVWIGHLVILMYPTGLDAKSELQFWMLEKVIVFGPGQMFRYSTCIVDLTM